MIPPALPHEILYGAIASLGAAVLILSGLWVKSHDGHRQWSTEQIHAHARLIAVLEHDYTGIREDLAEIKMLLAEHTRHDRRVHDALIRKLALDVQED